MEEIIAKSVDLFADFLNEITSKINTKQDVLASYILPLQTGGSQINLNNLVVDYSTVFYFDRPSEDFSFIGLNKTLSIEYNGKERLEYSAGIINTWKNKVIKNRDDIAYPVFVGGMKFTCEYESDEWADYKDSNWFVPEFLILNRQGNSYLVYNLLINDGFNREASKEKLDVLISILNKTNGSGHKHNEAQIKNIIDNDDESKQKWIKLVDDGLNHITQKSISKIVLSRKVELELSEHPDLNLVFSQFKQNYPRCYLFIYKEKDSVFFGATPEKLLKSSAGSLDLEALAGSAPRGLDENEDKHFELEYLRNKKNLNEHKIVVDHIKDSLSSFTKDLTILKENEVRKLKTIQHLLTEIKADLKNGKSILNIIDSLYPTPAICGYPKDKSLKLIKEMEGYDRGMYSGIIGWFNFDNDGEFAISIRSALSKGNKIYTYAGCGIVDGSEAEEEFKETELKLKPIISLFNNEG